MWPNPQETVDLVTITKEIFNEKLHFFCSIMKVDQLSLTESTSLINL